MRLTFPITLKDSKNNRLVFIHIRLKDETLFAEFVQTDTEKHRVVLNSVKVDSLYKTLLNLKPDTASNQTITTFHHYGDSKLPAIKIDSMEDSAIVSSGVYHLFTRNGDKLPEDWITTAFDAIRDSLLPFIDFTDNPNAIIVLRHKDTKTIYITETRKPYPFWSFSKTVCELTSRFKMTKHKLYPSVNTDDFFIDSVKCKISDKEYNLEREKIIELYKNKGFAILNERNRKRVKS